MLQGLQMSMPLMISSLIDHAATFHADTAIVARTIEGDVHHYTYGEAGSRTRRLARALESLGVAPGGCAGRPGRKPRLERAPALRDVLRRLRDGRGPAHRVEAMPMTGTGKIHKLSHVLPAREPARQWA